MSNHVSSAYVIKVKDNGYASGDAFWPTVNENIMKAARHAVVKDAKTYIKTAMKRLKLKDGDMKIVPVEVEYGDKTSVVSVKEKTE